MSRVDFPGTARHRVVRRLGEGGMGVVYEAIDSVRGDAVALKTLLRASPGAIYRFKQEFRTLADVSHPNLVTLHELVKHDDLWFFTMELVDGVAFDKWCGRASTSDGPPSDMPTIADDEIDLEATLPEVVGSNSGETGANALSQQGLRRLRKALRGLVTGLLALHDAGKLHRDVKPSNVLVDNNERVVLLDFGLAADLFERAPAQPRLARLEGTVAYMAPELASGGRPGPAADWYAVGTMLFETLTGRLPFVGQLAEVMQARRENGPPSLDYLEQQIPKDLADLCTDLLAPRPEDRPDGREILRRLGLKPPARRIPTRPWQSPDSISPFVGRGDALESLHNAFDEVAMAKAAVVHVHGPAGIGKSALLRHFRQRLTQPPLRAWILAGRCYEHELVPFKAVDSLVDALSRQLRQLPARRLNGVLPPGIAALARLFPVLNRVDAIRARAKRLPETIATDELRDRAFAAFRGLLFALGRSHPVVMIIDDLHWGDEDSATLLASALGPPEPPPVLLIVAYPSDATEGQRLLTTLRTAPAEG
ncbi:MAG: serine/threonine-protein kinase, partial [Myxococcota bacterium]